MYWFWSGRGTEYEPCQVGKHISEKGSQTSNIKDMNPLAQSNLEHGQDIISSKSGISHSHFNWPVEWFKYITGS